MKLVDKKITRRELKSLAKKGFGDFVKAVVDIEDEIMVVDAELHADEESFLLERGSVQESLWGINLYPEKQGDEFIEYDSMINLRPNQNNMSREVEDDNIRKRIKSIVVNLVKDA